MKWRRRLLVAIALFAALVAVLVNAAWNPACTWFGHVDFRGDASRRAVALTFDDGPDPATTPLILDTLRDLGVRATFFVIGERANRHPDLVRRMVDEGHLVGNHSWDHAALPWKDSDGIYYELSSTQFTIKTKCGTTPTLFRPPYGLRDPRVLAQARKLGLRTVLWSCSPRDWQDPGADAVVERTLSAVEPGDIVLLHDGSAEHAGGHPGTAEALARLVRGLRDRGYEAVRVDEILDHR